MNVSDICSRYKDNHRKSRFQPYALRNFVCRWDSSMMNYSGLTPRLSYDTSSDNRLVFYRLHHVQRVIYKEYIYVKN